MNILVWIIHELNEGTHTHTRKCGNVGKESTHLAQIIASKMSRQFSSMDISIAQIIYSLASSQKIEHKMSPRFSATLFSFCANICVRFHEWHTHTTTLGYYEPGEAFPNQRCRRKIQ